MDCGFYYAKTGGLFSNLTHEGVSANDGRRIRNGRSATDLGGSAGRNSNTGEAQPWPVAKSTPASSVRGLGFANRRTESTGVIGGSRGLRLGQKGGRRGRLERRPPWPTAKSFPAARKTAIQAIKRQGEGQGERGEHGGLTAGKKWVGDGSGKAVHGGSKLGGRRGFSERRWRPPKRERGRNWSGERERNARGLGFA